ncbi:MAG: DNA repair protein RecO [Candidatus Paceibacterota bacterium]|jgi:DNA repair protein RecO (recombination protein O)
MIEYFTEGIVLSKDKKSDFDGVVNIYTKDFGKISAKTKGIFKPTSKLSGHLEPLNLVNVRVVEKNGFQVTDALLVKKLLSSQAKNSINFYRQALELLSFVAEMTFDFQSDIKLWQTILKTLEAINKKRTPSYSLIIEALGFSPKFAQCQKCKAKPVRYFAKKDQVFYCSHCASKIPKEELVLV